MVASHWRDTNSKENVVETHAVNKDYETRSPGGLFWAPVQDTEFKSDAESINSIP